VCVCLSVLKYKNIPLHLEWGGRNRSEWERDKEFVSPVNLIGHQTCIKTSGNKTRRKDIPERLKRRWNNNTKMDINKSDRRVWTGFIWLTIGKASYQHSNDLPVQQNKNNFVTI